MERVRPDNTKFSLVLAVTACLVAGCDVEVEGEEGNFTFTYINSEMTTATELAEGSNVDIRVEDSDTDEAVELAEVYTEAADIADVIDVDYDRFTLEAVSSGRTDVTAEAVEDDDEGQPLSDSFEVTTAEVSTISLENRCASEQFVTGASGRMKYEMYDSGGDELTGYGYYPVTIEADGAVDPDDRGSVVDDYDYLGSLEFRTGSEPGSYQIVSDVNGESESFELIAPEDLDAIDVAGSGDATGSVDAGDVEPMAAIFALESAGDAVCGPLEAIIDISVQTPEVCSARYYMPLESLGAVDMHGIEVEGIESGDCHIEVSVPEAELSLDIDVQVN